MADRKRKLEVDDSPAAKKVDLGPEDDPTGGINPYTGNPYSHTYYEILKKRKGVASSLQGRLDTCVQLYMCDIVELYWSRPQLGCTTAGGWFIRRDCCPAHWLSAV